MQPLAQWRERILPAIDLLKRTSGTTEEEFLNIGARLHGFYGDSQETSKIARQLVGLLVNEDYQSLVRTLQRMIAEIDDYLVAARSRSSQSRDTLGQILKLLEAASLPLEGFQKMHKSLRMLGISTKIESARMGEMGSGFTVLAADVEKLSSQVNEKAEAILKEQVQLVKLIQNSLQSGRTSESQQDADVKVMLAMAMNSFEQLDAMNSRSARCGELAGRVADEVSAALGEVVSSMQTHDIVRQQIEHVSEALERLGLELQPVEAMAENDGRLTDFVSQTGDVCELQVAQLRYAGQGLVEAVEKIIDNLQMIGARQSQLADEVIAATGSTSGSSLFQELRGSLSGAGKILGGCAEADRRLFGTLEQVGGKIAGIGNYVEAIQAIGSEIDLLALNAQIKAAHTGREGAALGVLAEAIKRLSVEASSHAGTISDTLTSIDEVTENLVSHARSDQDLLDERVAEMGGKVEQVVSGIERMNGATSELFRDLVSHVDRLTTEINRTTSSITVHDTVSAFTVQASSELSEIVAQARSLVPAKSDFYQNLKHMTSRYTMQSERRIHEEIARNHSGKAAALVAPVVADAGGDSEFGDNVDLF